ncbi:MAG TPA: hypothetical protein VHZ03_44670 [Trebonia sp.]|nr:hypothetical protein [Trebonia sp.]
MTAGTRIAAFAYPSGSGNSAGPTTTNDAAVLDRLWASVPPEVRLPRLPVRDLALDRGVKGDD